MAKDSWLKKRSEPVGYFPYRCLFGFIESVHDVAVHVDLPQDLGAPPDQHDQPRAGFDGAGEISGLSLHVRRVDIPRLSDRASAESLAHRDAGVLRGPAVEGFQ